MNPRDRGALAQRAALIAGRCAHAKKFKRHNRELTFLCTRLGRIIRDIARKIDGDAALEEVFAMPLSKAIAMVGMRSARGPMLGQSPLPEPVPFRRNQSCRRPSPQ